MQGRRRMRWKSTLNKGNLQIWTGDGVDICRAADGAFSLLPPWQRLICLLGTVRYSQDSERKRKALGSAVKGRPLGSAGICCSEPEPKCLEQQASFQALQKENFPNWLPGESFSCAWGAWSVLPSTDPCSHSNPLQYVGWALTLGEVPWALFPKCFSSIHRYSRAQGKCEPHSHSIRWSLTSQEYHQCWGMEVQQEERANTAVAW